jgi:hygromycin-B 7''-O-kinase
VGQGVGRPSVSAVLRAKQALEAAGLDSTAELTPVAHTSNEVWFVGDHVLRVAADSREGRLAMEAHVSAILPSTVPHAAVIAQGTAALGEWLVMERMRGKTLAEWWAVMLAKEQREAIRQLAVALRALHAVKPSIQVLALAHGDTPHPLPASRTLELVDECRRLPGVEGRVMDAVAVLVRRFGDAFDAKEAVTGLVHGDLLFDNILWDGARITALLDLEWVRPGPPDLDLDILLQYCAEPELSTTAHDRFAVTAKDLADVPVWLEEDYPELFAHPRLNERLLLYRLAYDVRALLLDPPPATIADMPHHPYNRLRTAVLSEG